MTRYSEWNNYLTELWTEHYPTWFQTPRDIRNCFQGDDVFHSVACRPLYFFPSSRETLETLDDTSDSEEGSRLTISLWSNEATSCHQTTSSVIVVTERPPQKRQKLHTVRLRNSLAFLESNVLLSSSESDEKITPHMSTWWSYSLALKRRRLFPNQGCCDIMILCGRSGHKLAS